ncbi:LruC domain-containing protein [bacterium]|nr:LruC domain-containing protein [bacterium]
MSCGGGDSTPPGGAQPFLGQNTGGIDGMQGNITPPPPAGDLPPAMPVLGGSSGAPLGTDPAYEVQPASDIIETRLVGSGTSSLGKGASLTEGMLFEVIWVAVTARGEVPDPGLPNPPFYEGDEVDLYIRYEVAEGVSVSREWYLEAAGLHYIEPDVAHAVAGVYEAVFPFTLPYGSAETEAVFKGVLAPPRTVSAFILPDMGDFREVFFEILGVDLLPAINYPDQADSSNDLQGGAGGCLPDINATFNGDSVFVESTKEISNVVLEFSDGVHEKWDDLVDNPDIIYFGTFYGTGENDGKTIVRIWVKSGCNSSGEGPGYGERCEPAYQELAMAQMAWEDLLSNADYDYNDFVGRLRITEFRNMNNELVQVQLTVKAVARAAGYDADWQFNIGASFPTTSDVDVVAIVDQFYADGTPHGNQRVWLSAGGMSVPIFTPIRDALPNPPGSYATNGIPGTQFIDGDYAEVTIILNSPMPQGSYTPIPYEPELRVQASGGNVYTITLWTKPGDWVDSNGRPLAFIVPDTYAWPLEGKKIWTVYDGFDGWIDWINNQPSPEPDPAWYDVDPVQDYFDRALFL